MNRRSKREVTVKTDVKLIPQEHGGALLAGGKPGNKGGGRTPNELRALMREPLAKLLPIITEIAEAKDIQEVTCPHCDGKHEVETFLKAGDKLKAVDLLARYGIGTRQEVEHQGVTVVIDAESLSC
jgi:hypothetical protein